MAIHIGRREFIGTLGGAAAWPLAARAQQDGDAIVVDGVPDPELIPKLLLLRRRAIFFELPLTRDKDAEISAGRWQRDAVGRHDTPLNRLRFFAGLNVPVNQVRSGSIARESDDLARE